MQINHPLMTPLEQQLCKYNGGRRRLQPQLLTVDILSLTKNGMWLIVESMLNPMHNLTSHPTEMYLHVTARNVIGPLGNITLHLVHLFYWFSHLPKHVCIKLNWSWRPLSKLLCLCSIMNRMYLYNYNLNNLGIIIKEHLKYLFRLVNINVYATASEEMKWAHRIHLFIYLKEWCSCSSKSPANHLNISSAKRYANKRFGTFWHHLRHLEFLRYQTIYLTYMLP